MREGFDDDGFRKRSSQSILYSCLAKSDLDKVINDLQRKVNPSCVGFDETKAELRNLLASMNVDSGAWLKAGVINKRFIMLLRRIGETLLNVTLCPGSPLRWQVILSKVSRVGVTE